VARTFSVEERRSHLIGKVIHCELNTSKHKVAARRNKKVVAKKFMNTVFMIKRTCDYSREALISFCFCVVFSPIPLSVST